MIFNQHKKRLNIIIDTLLFVIIFFYFKNLFEYFFFISNSQWFLEPAENENLVLTNYIQLNYLYDLKSLILNGILPIYPDLFHQLGSLFNNNLFGLRLISIISFLSIQIGLFIYCKKFIKSLCLSLCIVILFFGNINHSIYFLMARPDSIYIFFGSISLLTLIYQVRFSTNRDSDHIMILISGALLALSILSKQTAIFFGVYSLFIIFYFTEKTKSFNLLLHYSLGLFSVLILYIIFINKFSVEYFDVGFKSYSNNFSFNMLISHIIEIIKNYFGYILIILLGLYKFYKSKRIFTFWMVSFLIVSAFSFKLFGNQGAFYNNFILFTSISSIFFVEFLGKFKKLEKNVFLKFIIFITLINSIYPNLKDGNLLSYFEKIKYQQISNGEFRSNKIVKFLENNNGEFLSGRNDNFLYFTNKKIYYEGSVFQFHGLKDIKELNLSSEIINLENDIITKINTQFFDGIIDGIGDNLMEKYGKYINEKYEISIIDSIFTGVRMHTIKLYQKKL